MDLAIQATSYSTANQIQNLVTRDVAATQPATALRPEANARGSRESASSPGQARQAPQARAAQANHFTQTDFIYKAQTHVMQVSDKDVLIYQVPPRGALEIIKAEIQEGIYVEDSA